MTVKGEGEGEAEAEAKEKMEGWGGWRGWKGLGDNTLVVGDLSKDSQT